ncbi:MAG TPA: hypothetical protein V6D17_23745 [Candidatus Obscuribacterales bacterium]
MRMENLLCLCLIALIGVGIWTIAPIVCLYGLNAIYRLSYAGGEGAPIFYAMGALFHEWAICFLTVRLGRDDILLAPFMEQRAVLLNAQQRYEEAEQMYRSAIHLYEKYLATDGSSDKKRRKVIVSYANMAQDYSSMLEIIDRRDDAASVLESAGHLIEKMGEIEVANKIKSEGRMVRERTEPH